MNDTSFQREKWANNYNVLVMSKVYTHLQIYWEQKIILQSHYNLYHNSMEYVLLSHLRDKEIESQISDLLMMTYPFASKTIIYNQVCLTQCIAFCSAYYKSLWRLNDQAILEAHRRMLSVLLRNKERLPRGVDIWVGSWKMYRIARGAEDEGCGHSGLRE